MSRICFINPPYNVFMESLDAPFNLMYLAAVAEQCGWEASIVDMRSLEDPLPKADVYAVTSTSPQWPTTLILSDLLAVDYPESLKIVGGPHVSAEPDDLCSSFFNLAILGEGEDALTDILQNYRFYLKSHYAFFPFPVLHGKPIGDLDSIPFPARRLVDWSRYKRGIYWGKEKLADAVSIISSRGCPFNCVFCGSHVVFGRGVRFRSVDNVVAEMKQVIDTMGYRGFNFHDDTFCVNQQRVFDLCTKFLGLKVMWRCLSRADTVDAPLLKFMGLSGCREIILGVETGSNKILKTLNKGVTAEQNLKAMRLVKESGIQLKTGIIVGSPGETWSTVKETEEMLKACPPDFWNVSCFTPFPGSYAWDYPKKLGIKILTRNLQEYAMVGKNHRGNVIVETEEMCKADIELARDRLIDLLIDISPP